ncbi:GNAT family N-acetyltransferase [Clostridium sp. ATCC 25772]|uniref:GNAT family N-acetyltransferase n=1 Tax=Clostridium sp. ATCC 25772 TaxID=1676991 RepID=UPI000780E917|nr:GNAT family N-acetyltransferase [Clostridium sp. ATCC 25772]
MVQSIKKLIIREAKIEDANEIIKLVKRVMREVQFFTKESEEFNLTIEQEIEYIKKTSLFLIAEMEGKIVGCTTLQKGNSIRTRHVSTFGITILKEYSGLKIGSALIKRVIEWAKVNEIEKIELEVFSKNVVAIGLYKKFGFIVEGVRNKNIKINGNYEDTLLLAKFL